MPGYPSQAAGGIASSKSGSKATVATPCPAYTAMADVWQLIDDLCGGTWAMRSRGTTWLPREDKESDPAYATRVGRSFLYGAYKDTTRKLGARPFAKDVQLKGKLPDKLKSLLKNTDREGTTISGFAQSVLTTAIRYGLTHVLVDYPPVPEGATLAQEKEMDVRPVFVHIHPENLLWWQESVSDEGVRQLEEIHIYECQSRRKDGTYELEEVPTIRVYTKTTWELWEKQRDSQGEYHWVKAHSGNHTFGAVPLLTFYTDKCGPMQATPPMQELAELNLAHWQSYSDYRNILRFSTFGTLFASGMTEEEVKAGVTIGPARIVTSTNKFAKMTHVEHSGAAITTARTHLQDLIAEMAVLGLQPLMESKGGLSATGAAVEESKSQSPLQAWVRALEQYLGDLFKMAAKWVNVTLPEDFEIDVYDDFGISMRMRDDILALIESRQMGEITSVTLLNEFKRRGLLPETIDAKEEAAAAKKEGPPEGARSSPGNPSGFGVRKDRQDKRDPSGKPGKRTGVNPNQNVSVGK